MPITVDRATVIHLAGSHRLSPALRDGAPALVSAGETAGRCGWQEFFAALAARGLAVSFRPDDPASISVVPRVRGRADADPAPSRGAFAEAARFLAALRGRYPPG